MGIPSRAPLGIRRLLLGAAAAVLLALGAGAGPASADPVVMAAGDVACDSTVATSSGCQQQYTSDLALAQKSSAEGLAALLVLGDEQYPSGSLSGFRSYFGPSWGRLGSTLKPVPGNHEYLTSGASGYFDYFQGDLGLSVGARGEGWYSFDVGAWHFVGVNSSDMCSPVSCAAGSPQETWLKADLAAHPAACTIAFLHHPLSSTAKLVPLWDDFAAAGVDLVLVGHVHGFKAPASPSGYSGGPEEAVVGTGGKSGGTYGLMKLTLHAGSADWTFVGNKSASGTIACGGATPPPVEPPTPKPAAAFQASTAGLVASFKDTSTNTPTSWIWDFGDGTTSGASDPTPNPVHAYAKPGTYTVELTAANDGGSTSVTHAVTVTAPPAGPPAGPTGPTGTDTTTTTTTTTPGPTVVDPAPRGFPPALSVARARATLRRSLRNRLRSWHVARLTCRPAGASRVRCSFRTRRHARRASGTALLTAASARGVAYRVTLRRSQPHRRVTRWSGRLQA